MLRRIAVALFLGCATCPAQTVFVDWHSVESQQAIGSIGSIDVQLTCDTADGLSGSASFVNGTFPYFNHPYFTPPLALSDCIYLTGRPTTPIYVFLFSRPVTNPVLHLMSFASTFTFNEGTPIVISGDSSLTVAGHSVTGVADNDNLPYNDSNGTIELPGIYTALTFSASYGGTIDGIRMQLGGIPCIAGDPNCDCVVDLGDLATLLAHFGTLSGATRADGDLDGNGNVDLNDLALLLANFGTTCP